MTANLLDVDGLRVGFPRGPHLRHVVAGIGYSIQAGRTLGVVGESAAASR
jgi:ABC-type microcin C transport system duplicated ATPase subunit YejF